MILSTNFGSASSFLTLAQVGSFPSTIMTLLITVATSTGGDANDLISAIYFLSRLSRASWAARRAGSAFLSSASASAASFSVSSFSLPIVILSPSIFFYCSSAFLCSLLIVIMRSSQIFCYLETSALLTSDS